MYRRLVYACVFYPVCNQGLVIDPGRLPWYFAVQSKRPFKIPTPFNKIENKLGTTMQGKFNQSTAPLLAFLALDLVFVVLHILLNFDILESDYFRIAKDNSYAEFYQYIKFIAAGGMLLYLSKAMGSPFVFVFSILSFYLCFDDAFKIHEQIGAMVSSSAPFSYLNEESLLDGQSVYGVIFAAFACLVGGVFWLRSPKEVKLFTFRLGLALGVLWLGAVVMDRIRDLVHWGYLVESILEEGLEHVGASLFLWLSLVKYSKSKEIDARKATTLTSDNMGSVNSQIPTEQSTKPK